VGGEVSTKGLAIEGPKTCVGVRLEAQYARRRERVQVVRMSLTALPTLPAALQRLARFEEEPQEDCGAISKGGIAEGSAVSRRDLCSHLEEQGKGKGRTSVARLKGRLYRGLR
jgi:hypothetical protein